MFVPALKVVPDGGAQVTFGVVSQLSRATTLKKTRMLFEQITRVMALGQ